MHPGIVVFIAVLIVYFVGQEILKHYFDAKVQMLYGIGMYDACIDFLDHRLPRMVMTTFKQYYLRFMVYEAAGNTVAAEKMLEHLLNFNTRSRKKEAALNAAAFNFYAKNGRRKQAEKMLAEVVRTAAKPVAADCQLTFDIVFKGRHDLIGKMEQMLPDAQPDQRAKLYFLLAKQCNNAGDRAGARRYQNLLKQLEEAQRAPKPRAASGDADGAGATKGKR